MHIDTNPVSSADKDSFSYIPNLNQILENPACQDCSFTWEQVQVLQNYLYPGTENLRRNIIIVPYPSHPRVQEHTHDYFEMLFVLSGSCAHYIDKNYSLLHEGDFCILPPGMPHYVLHEADAQLGLIMIRSQTLKSLFSMLSTGQDLLSVFLHNVICKESVDYYLLFHTEKNQQIRKLLYSLKEEMLHNDEYSDHLALSKFSTFLLNVARFCQDAEISSGQTFASQDQKILSMIYKQYDTITLSQLAETLHYSVPYCSKYLKKNIGCTFSELIQKIRFQEARNLLLTSNLPVNQIGKKIGYETPENFFRAFKKVYGITPSQYRKTKGALPMQKEHPFLKNTSSECDS